MRGAVRTLAIVASVTLASLSTPAIANERSAAPAPKLAASALSKQQAEAIAVVEKFHDAIKAGDNKLAEQALSPTVQIFEQGHRESSRDEYLGHHFKEDAAFAKVVPSVTVSRDARVLGEMALVMSESTSQGTYKDRPVNVVNLSTYVLVKQDGAWRITHIHWSSRKRT